MNSQSVSRRSGPGVHALDKQAPFEDAALHEPAAFNVACDAWQEDRLMPAGMAPSTLTLESSHRIHWHRKHALGLVAELLICFLFVFFLFVFGMGLSTPWLFWRNQRLPASRAWRKLSFFSPRCGPGQLAPSDFALPLEVGVIPALLICHDCSLLVLHCLV